MSAQPETVKTQQSRPANTPSNRGEISGWRTGVFFILAIIVATAIGTLAYMAFGIVPALLVFVVALLATFTPFYVWDASVSSGYSHRRMELVAEDNKSRDAVQIALANANVINNEQELKIATMQDDILTLQQAVESLRTVTITDRSGSRVIPAHDDIDMSITAWLSQSVFGPNGMLAGVHEKSGVLKGKYPFSGKDERSIAAHTRLTRAGLVDVRQPGNQYAWIGPITLSETRRKLTPVKAKTPT